jgi:hypothetical protein
MSFRCEPLKHQKLVSTGFSFYHPKSTWAIMDSELEQWQAYTFPEHLRIRNNYMVSSRGRVLSFRKGVDVDGQLLKGANNRGYLTINLRGKERTAFIHRLVATLFLPRPTPQHKYVIHLNHCKKDNDVTNLRWVTAEELRQHRRHCPAILASRQRRVLMRDALRQKTRAKKLEQMKFEERVGKIKRIAAAIARC